MKVRSFVIVFILLLQSMCFSQWMWQINGLPELWYHGNSIDASGDFSIISFLWSDSSGYPDHFYPYKTEDMGINWSKLNINILNPDVYAVDISIIIPFILGLQPQMQRF